ncbi:hypothetical protein [Pantoea sp. App145]|uniref:hypothetical protein n=1 Tax=Pantoea sp. App145 TaxID=3071567 RepID=UPI003A80FF9A
MRTNTISLLIRKQPTVSLTLVALAIGFSAGAWGKPTKPATVNNDNFVLQQRTIAPISPLNRILTADFSLKTSQSFNGQKMVYVRICGDVSDADPHTLAQRFYPAAENDVPVAQAVALTLKPNVDYRILVPMAYDEAIDKAVDKKIGLSVSLTPLKQAATDCSSTADVLSIAQNVKVLPLSEVTPVIRPLDWKLQTIQTAPSNFSAVVDVLGATSGDKVSWTSQEGDEPAHDQALVAVGDITSSEVPVAGKMLPAEVIGKRYQSGVVSPTRMDYSAKVTVKAGDTIRETQYVVGGSDSPPMVSYKCDQDSPTQCVITWGATVPYVNEHGSLGINTTTGWLSLSKVPPPDIYAIQPTSHWQQPSWFPTEKEFKGQQATGNTGAYMGAGSSLFSDGIMPHQGSFTLNFEPLP